MEHDMPEYSGAGGSGGGSFDMDRKASTLDSPRLLPSSSSIDASNPKSLTLAREVSLGQQTNIPYALIYKPTCTGRPRRLLFLETVCNILID